MPYFNVLSDDECKQNSHIIFFASKSSYSTLKVVTRCSSFISSWICVEWIISLMDFVSDSCILTDPFIERKVKHDCVYLFLYFVFFVSKILYVYMIIYTLYTLYD